MSAEHDRQSRFGLKSSRRNEGLGIRTEKTMKIHSALDAGGRAVKMATATSWDLFQAQAKWEMPKRAGVELAIVRLRPMRHP